MFCTRCGKPLSDDASFCAYCGQPVIQQTEQPFVSPYDSNESAPTSVPVYKSRAVELPHSGSIDSYPVTDVSYVQPSSANAVLIGALSSVSVLLIVACVLLFVKPGYLRQAEVQTSSDSDKSVSGVISSENTGSHPFESTATELESETVSSESVLSTASSKAASSKQTSSKAAASKATSSKAASSKAVSSKAASSKAASSKSASSKAASSKSASSKAASSKAASSKSTSSKAASSKVTSSKAVSEVIVSEPVSQHEPEPQSEPSPSPEPDHSADDAAYAEAMAYSTYQRPTFDEFEWCYGQNGFIYEPPASGSVITNDLGFSGGWKCMIIYNPTNIEGTYIRELDNVDIVVENGLVDLTIDWYLMTNDTQAGIDNEESMPDLKLTGSSLGGGISVSNDDVNTSMIISSFWKENGYEYALGTMQLSDGMLAYVALTR